MNIKSQILDAIDDINLITYECEYNTICEMYNSYDKASLILEYYEGEDINSFNMFNDTDNIYQESSVPDKMKNSGAKYNTLMKILTFIPRLIKALFQTIKEKFKKTKPSKELQKAPKEVKEKLATAFDKKKDKKKRIAIAASLMLGAGAVGVATGVGVHKLSGGNDNTDVEKEAENIVNNIDNNLEDINNRYKNLVNKLYSHDSMPLPEEENQSFGVRFNDKKDSVEYIYDRSDVGMISFRCLYLSLIKTNVLMLNITTIRVPNDGEVINRLNESTDTLLKRLNDEKKEEYQNNSDVYSAGFGTNEATDTLEKIVEEHDKYIDKFNKRSEEDKKIIMTQTVQNAIKALNNESKFYRDIFYEFLSLCGEMTKLIDDTYSSLKVKVSDEYKFNEDAERVSKFKTDIPSLMN